MGCKRSRNVSLIFPFNSSYHYNIFLQRDHCLAKECDFLFVVDSVVHLDNQHTLKLLIEQNRTVVAPIMLRHNKVWSNFWGELTKDGFYARSNDYMDIVHNDKRWEYFIFKIILCFFCLWNYFLQGVNRSLSDFKTKGNTRCPERV